jgi:transposase
MIGKKKQRSYAKDFKLQAIKQVVEDGRVQKEVARDLGVPYAVLNRWVAKFRNAHEEAFPGRGNLKPEDEKVRQLEERLRRVTEERDILKKAIAYFAEVPK